MIRYISHQIAMMLNENSYCSKWKCTSWHLCVRMCSSMRESVCKCVRVFVQTIGLIWGSLSQSWGHVGDAAEGLFEEQGLHSCRLNSKLSFKAPSSCISWKINTRLSSCGFCAWERAVETEYDFFARLAVLSWADCLLDIQHLYTTAEIAVSLH